MIKIELLDNKIITDYIKLNGIYCPRCTSGNLKKDNDIDITDGVVVTTAICNECKLQWNEFYILSTIVMKE